MPDCTCGFCALSNRVRGGYHDGMAQVILVSAASSLMEAFREIGSVYKMAKIRFNFAASGPLAQQIQAGAPVDVFAAASPLEMDQLDKAGRVEKGSRVVFASNRLVLIVPKGSRVKGWSDLKTNDVKRVALSQPASVPSGRYARETLVKRGLWLAVQPKAVFGENVRQTLSYVAGGDVDAGLVFSTDARIERLRVRVAATALAGRDHAPILYPAAVVAGAPHADAARQFVRFLAEPVSRRILARHGFLPPTPAPAAAGGRK